MRPQPFLFFWTFGRAGFAELRSVPVRRVQLPAALDLGFRRWEQEEAPGCSVRGSVELCMHFVGVALVAGCVAQGALANDLAGFRVEGMLGWDRLDGSLFGSADGLLYGVGAGYDFGLGETLALGVDGEISGTTGNQDISLCGPGPGCTTIGRTEAGRDLYVGVRLTGKVADRVAVYGKVGYADLKARVSYDDEAVYGPSASRSFGGWRAGFGAQYLWDSLYAGLEYRYTDHGSGGFALDGLTRHQLAANVGVRF